MEEKKTILDVKHLRVDFTTDQGTVQAVRDVSFSVKEGEILEIVGDPGWIWRRITVSIRRAK